MDKYQFEWEKAGYDSLDDWQDAIYEENLRNGEFDNDDEEKREIKQIAFSVYQLGTDKTVALCNDGTVWAIAKEGGRIREWYKYPPIPQDKE